jgi:hypothetical protein
MKKITLVLVTLAFVAGMAVAEDVTLSVSGSATLEWGFAGQLIDNTGSFLDAELPSGDFYSSATEEALENSAAPAFTMMLSVEDEDGNVFVEAAAEEIALDDGGSTTFVWEEAFDAVFDYISFPNVIPGVLGITLEGDEELEPSYVPSGSTTSNESILVNITPMDDMLDVTVGVLVKPDNPLYTNLYDVAGVVGTVADDGLFTWADDGDIADGGLDDDDDVDFSDGIDLDTGSSGWESGSYLSWAASLEATFTMDLGDEDEVSIGVGTVLDSAFNNEVYIPDYLVDTTDYTYSSFTEDATTINEAGTEAVIAQMYGTQEVNALSYEDLFPGQFGSADEAKMLRTNQVLGRATIPVGVGIGAAVGDLTADVDFQMVLTEGKDSSQMTGTRDFVDLDKSTHDYAAFAMPMYAAVDVGYELAVGDMTITPGLNFKYCSDFWNWSYDAADDEVWEYDGLVTGADFVGRPMSIDVGLDVEGIAGMIDIGISAGLSLGDGAAGGHGPLPAYTITADDTGATETYVYDNTLAEIMDFWFVQPTKSAEAGDYPTEAFITTALAAAAMGIDIPDLDSIADSASDGLNNMWFSSGNSAMDIAVDISAEVIDGLTIENTTTYTIDNLGIGGVSDSLTNDDYILFGTQLSSLENETVVEYAWMMGDAVAFTIFGEFTYASTSYATEAGQTYIGLRTADDPAGANDRFEFQFSEAPSMATFDYAVGVKCDVGL